ncbi:MAG TPA: plastocyanin/azurin family copper-binding protein [Gemmatimonadales bacterium]|nr:plastocyanin/azurin family copper-binding protein [Gemmatimonadales bacterium]
MWRARFATTLGLATALACKSTTSPACSGTCVTIRDFSFSPASLTIKVGTTVTWINAGPSAHTVTADSGQWDSGTLAAPSGGGAYGGGTGGGSFSMLFDHAGGPIGYHCKLHPPPTYPTFTGTITVTP